MKQETKQCQNCKKEFIIDEQDFAFYEKIKVPAPTWCPECRLIRRFTWTNFRTLYTRTSPDNPNKNLISMYSKDNYIKIMDDRKWWSDEFEALDYGRDYDFNKPFFEQMFSLMKDVPMPHVAREQSTSIDSEYCNGIASTKNCHLCFGLNDTENASYAFNSEFLKDCVDTSFSWRNESCYESSNIKDSYKVLFSQNCDNCYEMMFSQDCIGCNNCFGCYGLRNKQYHIFNKPFSKEDYIQELEKFDVGSYKGVERIKKQVQDFFVTVPHKYYHGRNNKDFSGDYVSNSKNARNVFVTGNAEDVRYIHFIKPIGSGISITSSYDYSFFGVRASLVYDSVWCGLDINSVKFSYWNYGVQDTTYCVGCHSCTSLFGCVGLRNKQYCILNKQYTKEQYNELVPKIRKHMMDMPYIDKEGRVYGYGEFFPTELSPFAYNETLAQEYFPLTKEQAIEQGYTWKDLEERNMKIDIKTEDIPDNIKDIKDDIIGKIIQCEHQGKCNEQCTEAFKIIPQELDFYRKMSISLPRLCPNCRHYQRVKQRNPIKLWNRQCNKCNIDIETSYSPDRPEIVYCEDCYKKEVN